MKAVGVKYSLVLLAILSGLPFSSPAIEIQRIIEGKGYADIIAGAAGLKITDDGVVYVTSVVKGSLLKIADEKIDATSLATGVFSDTKLGGIDFLGDGNLVVANQNTGKIAVLDSDYQRKIVFSQSGNDPGELGSPRSIAASVNNNIYAADVSNRQISVFNDQGLFLHSFGRLASDSENTLKPTHIDLDADENIYVLDSTDRFSIYDVGGNLVDRITANDLKDQFPKVPEFSALAVDLNGSLYLGDRANNQIAILDWRNRKVLDRFGSLGESRAQYRKITFLSVNNRGQIAVLDSVNKKIEVFQLDKNRFKTPKLKDTVRFASLQNSNCRAIYVFSENNNLCIKNDQKGIVLIDGDGREVGEFAPAIKNPTTLHSDSNRVAILEGNMLHVYDRNGKNLFSIGRFGIATGGFQNPSDVFVHGSQVYVSDVGNNRIQVFGEDGQFVEEIEGRGLFNKAGPIAVDSNGLLYVADNSDAGMIRVISKSRKLIASIGREERSMHKATHFHAIDIDKQNRLYVLARSKHNEFGVTIYRDFRPYMRFGAGANNGTDIYFDNVGSMSVASSSTNSIHINDSVLKRHYRFDLFEYLNAALGLEVGANKKEVKLEWSSSRSPLISYYEIQMAGNEDGPYKTVSTTSGLSHIIPNEVVGDNLWFQVISVSAHGLRGAPSVAKENYFQKMSKLYDRGEYKSVIKLAEKILNAMPDNDDARDLLAMSLFHLEDYTAAISVFAVLENNPYYRQKAIKHQVQAFYFLEQYLDARALIDKVLATDPTEVEPYLVCAQLSFELDDAIGAVTCAEDGLALQASHIELQYLLGRAYVEAGLKEEGLNAYQAVIIDNPDNHEIRLKIAADLYAMQNYALALEHYDYVSRKKSGLGEAAVGKARTLLELGRDDEARALAVKLSGVKETRADGNYLLGKIAVRQSDYKKAVLRFTRASKENPGLVDAWISLGEAYSQIKQVQKGIKVLEQGISKNPEVYELYVMAGKMELSRDRYVEANSHLEKAVNMRPQSLMAQQLYAQSLLSTRNYRLAVIHAEAAAGIAPRDIEVLKLQADIANQQGKTGSAIEYLKTALSMDAASPELHFQIGRIYQDANLFDISREHLEKSASIKPVWAEPHIALGNLYTKRRLFDEAIASYTKAIELDPSDKNRAILNIAFNDRKKSLDFENNAPQLNLSDLNLQTIFSSAYKKYQDKPIGSVILKNESATDYGNLKLSFQIREYMDFPTTVELPNIAGNQSQKIDIKATFNNKILEVDEDTGVQVEVKLTYQRDGQKNDITLTQPMTIYGKNAIVWSDALMVGSFVTPKDDTLRDFVRQVVNEYQPESGLLNDNLMSAMVYFSSLTASGINYVLDPNTPFPELRIDQIDYVQFPRETLQLKSGDCDDLSVLISAGLENLGISTAFVETPGHLFLMFDTGMSADDAGLISQDGSLLAIKDGNVWIPLEATMINASFIEAWAEGARKYHQALSENSLDIIDLSQAWKQYKPVTLGKASYSVALPEAKSTRGLVDQAQKVLLSKSIDRLIMPYQVMVTNNPANIAARLQIAILYARFGLYQDAEAAFDTLDELAPGNSAVKTNRGNLYFLQQDYTRAISNYLQATSLDSEDGGIWINLSMAYYKAGNLNEAKSSFQRAVQLNPALKSEYTAYAKLLSQ